MHLSHLGLTVSHIPSATSFYLTCLQPLGYRYIGHRGDSIGLGVSTADFFLSQEQNGDRIAPTHIAFAAKDRDTVHDCYAAALRAGAAPSGAPSYRNDDCTCFNAAVHDFDGNTIEFVYDETCATGRSHDGKSIAPSQHSKGSGSAYPGSERRSSCNDARSSHSNVSHAAPSRYQTALELAAATSKSMSNSNEPTPGIARSKTEPIKSKTDSKALMGTIMGAAAGAAFVYAAWSTERSNARDEAEYNTSIGKSSKGPTSSGASMSKSIAGRSDSTSRRKHPPRSMSRGAPHAIEAPPVFNEGVWETTNHYTAVHRPSQPTRSRTYDPAPITELSRRDESRSRIQRSSTLPVHSTAPTQRSRAPSSSREQQSTRSIRRGSAHDFPPSSQDRGIKSRQDSVVGPHASELSRRYSQAEQRSSTSNVSTIKPTQRQRSISISVGRGNVSQRAEEVPLPASHAGSYNSGSASASAAQVALPASRVSTSSYRRDRNTAPMSASRGGGRGRSLSRDVLPSSSHADHLPPRENLHQTRGQVHDAMGPEVDDESDGLGDCKTVVPEDSISCVDFSSRDNRRGTKQGGPVRRTSTASSRRLDSARASSSSRSKTASKRAETVGDARTSRLVKRDGLPPASGDGRAARTVINLPARSWSKNGDAIRGWHSTAMGTH